MEWYLNNREIIRNLAINTGTSANPSFTGLDTLSKISLDTEFEKKDFYVFIDAIKRSIITGAKLTLSTTAKIDMNNSAFETIFGAIHSVIASGTVAQLNNILVQFELLEKVTTSTLTYKKYQVPVCLTISSMGGDAEGEGTFEITMDVNGKGTIITA